jgi:predicted phosphodiesterase
MKFKLLSDLHMELNRFKHEHHGEDVVLLAGDIHTKNRHHELLNQIPEHVRVIMIAGNHSYYHGNFQEVNKFFENLHKPVFEYNPTYVRADNGYPNFTFLNNEAMVIDDIHIYGGTMFTDFELYGIHEQWFTEHDANRGIADFHHIEVFDANKYEHRQWTIQDHKDEHKKFVRGLEAWLKETEGQKRIVLTHFMPTPRAIPERFRNSNLNPYFCANMERFMGWEGVWAFGHTHDSFDEMFGDTRVVCNPHGYRTENIDGFKPDFIFEV